MKCGRLVMERSIKIAAGATIVCSLLVVSLIALQMWDSSTRVLPTLAFEEIEQGLSCGIRARINYVIDDLETWETLWTDLYNISTVVPDLPYVNFTSEVLFAVFLGEFVTGGYVAEITRIAASLNGLTVYVREQHPGAGCLVTMSPTQPYHIVKASVASMLSVEFVYNLVVHNCP